MRRSRSGTGRRFGVNENACVSAAPPALEVHRDENRDEDEEVDQPGLVEPVERDDGLDDTDHDAGDERPAERHHPADHRGGECAHERARAEGHEVGRRPRLARDERDRQRRQRAGHGPHERRHASGADAVEAREVAVLGRRLHGLAERRAGEEPREEDRHERHDDQNRELRARDPDRRDLVRRADRQREAGRGRVDLRVRDENRERQLGDADRGDQHDDAARRRAGG